MKIKTMTASFGKLERARLELGDGLTILEGPNEGGKSTWAGFLKAMLYGIDTKDRDRKGHLADKNRYQPWSGAPMEGEITLEWGGRDITIRRGKKGNAPFGAFSAVYTGTEEPVPGLTGDNCGELLTGVGREVFERSAFIGQSGMALTSAPELERRIAALVSSGQEDVSFSLTDSRLREWSNRRRVNKTVGLIPKLEGELEQTARELERLDQITAAIARGEGERAGLLKAQAELKAELDIHQRIAQHELNRRFAQAEQDYAQARQALETLEKEQARFGQLPEKDQLKRAQGELQFIKVLEDEIKQGEAALKQAEEDYVQANIAIQDEHFNAMTGEEARARAAGEIKTRQDQLKQSAGKGKLFLTFQILGAVLGCGVCAAGAAGLIPQEWALPQYLPYAVGVGSYGVFAAVSLLFLRGKNKCKRSAAQILERYGVDAPEGITALAEDYARRWQAAEDCAAQQKQIRGALNDRKARLENDRLELLDFVHTFAPEVKDLFGCSAALSRALGLEDRMRESTEKMQLTRRRRDDLEHQGGQLADTMELLHAPARAPEDTRTDLDAVQWELEQVNRALDMARGQQQALGDPAALSARQEQLRQQLERRTQEQQALALASEALTAANARLQERFSPALSRLAGEWMSRLTGGKYTSVALSKEFEASAAQTGQLPHKALTLSKGTVDQLYLAVRLAVCQLCLPEDERPPLLLDDALVTFDDGRMEQALACLEELARERQVLLFTCQSREGKALQGHAGVRQVKL